MAYTYFIDIQIALDKSEYIKQRAYFMKTLEIPKLSTAVDNLGKPLASVVFEECDEELGEYFGLTPPLRGAGDELWVSPSDLLIGKVVLKPPLTSKHIQALTHQGILDIGREIEIKHWNEMEMEKEQALAEQKNYLLDEFQDRLEQEIRAVELRECIACRKKLDLLTQEFEAALIEELLKLENRLREEFEEYSKNQEERLRQEWEQKLKLEVQKTVQRMTVEFLKEIERQEAIMANNLKLELQKRDIQKQYEIGVERVKCRESIRELKHNLECRNIANMMYILCMERRKCCEEIAEIENYYKDELDKLNNIIDQNNLEIKKLIKLNLRETCLLEILRQFQKFINFALKAAPTQAEFLLSVEKMMVFELADTILKTNFTHLMPCDKVLPWRHPQVTPPGSVQSGLFIEDHHDCFNEITPPRSEGYELDADDFLPAFSFNENLYVREDFRNMLSQGIEISKSNDLWSKDVEILMDVLKKSVSDIKMEEVIEEDAISFSGVGPENEKRNCFSNFVVPLSKKYSSSIYFSPDEMSRRSRVKRVSLDTSVDTKMSIKSKRSLYERKASCKPNPNVVHTIDFEKIGKVERKLTLIAAANSLELILKRGSVKPIHQYQVPDEDIFNEEESGSDVRMQPYIQSKESFTILKHTDTQQDDVTSTRYEIKEPIDGILRGSKTSKQSKESLSRAIKVSHVEIIGVQDGEKEPSVAFSVTPNVYETKVALVSENISQIYKKPENN
ncbi:hypothetical protein NQ317_008427, partial [Molorchus minor]